jgi:hypothetical protein
MATLLHLWADAPPGDERPEQGIISIRLRARQHRRALTEVNDRMRSFRSGTVDTRPQPISPVAARGAAVVEVR